MQAKDIKIGEEYAATYKNREVGIRVTSMRSEKDDRTTENYAVGFLMPNPEDGPVKIAVPVKAVISLLIDHQEGRARQEAYRAEQKAKADALKAKQDKAIKMLAEAIGATPLYERNYSIDSTKAAYVSVDGTERIEISAPAWDALIEMVYRAARIDA